MDLVTVSKLSADIQGIDSNALSYGVLALGPFTFAGFWVGILLVMGKLSGWGRLAERYAAATPAPKDLYRFRSARVGWAGYNNCLTIGGDMRGLYLAMFPVFRPGHAPLYVPWHDLTAEAGSHWKISYVEFRTRQIPDVRIRVARPLAEVVIESSGGQLRIDEPNPPSGGQDGVAIRPNFSLWY